MSECLWICTHRGLSMVVDFDMRLAVARCVVGCSRTRLISGVQGTDSRLVIKLSHVLFWSPIFRSSIVVLQVMCWKLRVVIIIVCFLKIILSFPGHIYWGIIIKPLRKFKFGFDADCYVVNRPRRNQDLVFRFESWWW